MDRQSSLERQVRRAAFGLAMLVVVTLGTVAIMTAIYSMQGNLVASQNAALKILAGNIQTTLNRQIEAMHELSINPPVWTAISAWTESSGLISFDHPPLGLSPSSGAQWMERILMAAMGLAL